jgi:nucleoside-diphosphate kinase
MRAEASAREERRPIDHAEARLLGDAACLGRVRLSISAGISLFLPTDDNGGAPMATERTFSIIKPDATARNLTGKIIAKLEDAGLRVVAQKRVRWTKAQAEKFYEVHKERPFYGELVAFMTSGPIVMQVLEGEDAVAKNRQVMGATNPANAEPGTIRREFAENIERNSVHGSDSAENAAIEIALCFKEDELVG